MDEELKEALLEHLRVMIGEDKRLAKTVSSAREVLEKAKLDADRHHGRLHALSGLLTEYGVEYEEIWNEEYQK